MKNRRILIIGTILGTILGSVTAAFYGNLHIWLGLGFSLGPTIAFVIQEFQALNQEKEV
ncbi:hypothetical protein ACFOSV_00695 [Algoriphagus namhaensis]|uniref:Major facilitator superfamily (MFS) profile domain-containing protein n=1 Tax=Algoriphagus namhaensis TaxID=915353 RepID=A0ABV8AP34_9BACT